MLYWERGRGGGNGGREGREEGRERDVGSKGGRGEENVEVRKGREKWKKGNAP